jgi:hypothetical protein
MPRDLPHPRKEAPIAFHGGARIDLGQCGRAQPAIRDGTVETRFYHTREQFLVFPLQEKPGLAPIPRDCHLR